MELMKSSIDAIIGNIRAAEEYLNEEDIDKFLDIIVSSKMFSLLVLEDLV